MSYEPGAGNENKRLIFDLALERVQAIEAASDVVDRKAETLLAFLAVVIAIALQAPQPARHWSLDLACFYSAFVSFFASVVFLVLSIAARIRRFDPSVKGLFHKYWSAEYESTLQQVTSNLAESWEKNVGVHAAKVKWYQRALLPSVLGLFLLAVDVLVLRWI